MIDTWNLWVCPLFFVSWEVNNSIEHFIIFSFLTLGQSIFVCRKLYSSCQDALDFWNVATNGTNLASGLSKKVAELCSDKLLSYISSINWKIFTLSSFLSKKERSLLLLRNILDADTILQQGYVDHMSTRAWSSLKHTRSTTECRVGGGWVKSKDPKVSPTE